MPSAFTYRGTTPKIHIFQKAATVTNNSPRTQSYNTLTDTWAAASNGAVSIERGAVVGQYGGECVVTGGAIDAGASFTVQANTQLFNADAGTYASGRTNPAPRDGASCCTIRGLGVLMVGGTATGFTSTGDRGTTKVQEFALGIYGDNVSETRTAITGARTEAGYGQSVASNALAARWAVIAGGYARSGGNESYLSSVYEYDASDNTWTAKTSLAAGQFAGGCFTINNSTFIVAGGIDNGDGSTDTPNQDNDNTSAVQAWDRTTNVWDTSHTNLPGAKRRSLGAGQVSGIGYAVGGTADGTGFTNYALNYSYNPTLKTWTTLTNYTSPASFLYRGAAS